MYRPSVQTQADLEEIWRELMGPWGFGRGSLWMVAIGPDDVALPQIVEIRDDEDDDAPLVLPRPDDRQRDGLAGILRHLADESEAGVRFAFLRSRPGRDGVSADDRAWAEMLYAAGRAAGVRLEVVHRANDAGIVPVPLDELGLRECRGA